jgi:hypothetical protein
MAVTFTPNINLAKPSEAELAANWINGTQLADDNNVIVIAETTIPITSYTPAFITATTQPNVGAGFKQGEYSEFQGFIFGLFTISFVDPGIVVGTGVGSAYGISLPFPVDPVFHTVGAALNDVPGLASCIGEGYIRDDSSVALSGTVALDVVTIASVSYARLITENYATKTSRFWEPNTPPTMATQDQITAQFWYRKQ